ncbi:MAG: trigger factor [Rhizobacter sp.]|nr:trigger factor [Chlorobiales bacterium]
METVITTLSPTEQELTLTLQPAEFQSEIDQRYKSAQLAAELKGFRKGKVPMDMIKHLMGKDIEQDAIESLAQKFFADVADEKNLKLIGRARIRHFELMPAEKLTIYLQYEVEPDFTLAPFENYTFKQVQYEIDPADVEREVKGLLKQQGVLIASDVEAGDEDFVTADMQKLDHQNVPIIGKRFENQTFSLGDTNLNPALRKALVGAKSGDDRNVSLEYIDKENKPQHDHYRLSVKEVKKMDLPELTDALAEELTQGRYTAAADLRKGIEAELTAHFAQRSENDLREDIAAKFVDDNRFDVPSALIASFQNSFVEDAKQRLGGTFPKGFEVEAFKREIRPNAERQARWTILKRKLTETSGVKIEPEDFKALAVKESGEMKDVSPEQLLQYYTTEQMRYVVAERILNEKIYDFLKTKVKLTPESRKSSSVKDADPNDAE